MYGCRAEHMDVIPGNIDLFIATGPQQNYGIFLHHSKSYTSNLIP